MNEWDKQKAAERMVAYVESHLREPITFAHLAKAARYSPWHAARIFKERTGKTPFEYIRLRRLAAAAERLSATDERVIDVAFDFLFDSHDGFTRAFSRYFGLTPRQYQKQRSPRAPFLPIDLRERYLQRMKGLSDMASKATTVFVQVVEHPVRKLIVRRARTANHYFEYCEEVGCDIWEELGRIEGALREPMGLWLPDRLRPEGTSKYVQGVEVPGDFAGKVPEGYEVIELAPCKMMVFQGPPFEDKDFTEAIGALWDSINEYRPELYGFAWADDDAPRFQLAPLGYRGYIEGRPVRAISESSRVG